MNFLNDETNLCESSVGGIAIADAVGNGCTSFSMDAKLSIMKIIYRISDVSKPLKHFIVDLRLITLVIDNG